VANDGVGLSVRLHDLLLAMAGRIDDDALSQARELLAVAELDRAVELLVGTLMAGRIPVTADERHEIRWLLDELRSEPALADRLGVVDVQPVPRHRFTAESDPTAGVADALDRAVSVLPDVRSVRCVWRSSPAGATPGPLPQRLVLVDIGSQGFAPATAYRLDTVLRRAGVRAAIEVLRVGTQLSEYHAAAVTTAREVYFADRTQVVASSGSRHSDSDDSAAWFDGTDASRQPAPVTEPAPVPETVDSGSQKVELPRRSRSSDAYEGAQPFPPKPVKRLPVREPESVVEESHPVVPEPTRAEETTEMGPDDLAALQAALAEPVIGASGVVAQVPPSVDANLSDRERALLQQLHEELAQREQAAPPKPNDSGRWQVDRSGNPNGSLVQHSNGRLPFPPAG
jgi:hypothetical protein